MQKRRCSHAGTVKEVRAEEPGGVRDSGSGPSPPSRGGEPWRLQGPRLPSGSSQALTLEVPEHPSRALLASRVAPATSPARACCPSRLGGPLRPQLRPPPADWDPFSAAAIQRTCFPLQIGASLGQGAASPWRGDLWPGRRGCDFRVCPEAPGGRPPQTRGSWSQGAASPTTVESWPNQ